MIKNNFNVVIETQNKLSKIVEETLYNKHGVVNENVKTMAVEYKSEWSEDAENDLKKITGILTDVYNHNSFDCFCITFAEACNLCFEYALIDVIESDRIVDTFTDIATELCEQQFLKEFGQAIFSQGKSEDNMMNFLTSRNHDEDRYTIISIYNYIYAVKEFFDAVMQKDDKQRSISMCAMYYARENLTSLDERFFDYIAPKEISGDEGYFEFLPYIEYRDTSYYLKEYRDCNNSFEQALYLQEPENNCQYWRYQADRALKNALENMDKSGVMIANCNKNSYFYRANVLNHPLPIWNMPILNELHHMTEKVIIAENANKELEKEKKEKISMVNDFSHRYGKRKESYLKDIAEYLLNIDNQDVRYYGRLALYEVSRKYNMDKDVEILKDKFSNNNEFLEKIRNSTKYYAGESNLQFIIDETIKTCIITLLYDKTIKGKELRYKVFEKENPEDIDDILYDFEEKVIVNGNSALAWIKEQKIVDLRFDINGLWNNLSFYENEYSAVFFTGILSELIFNAIKYADQKKPIEISFFSDNDFLIITEANTINHSIVSASGKGIESTNNLIKRFHEPLNLYFDPVRCSINENVFYEEIGLSKKLFMEG